MQQLKYIKNSNFMKIYNLYENEVDKTWYDSSTILYSECKDVKDDYKILKVVFKNGSCYEYREVDVNDYMLFREDISQGKALRKYISKFPYEKNENVDVKIINEELEELKKKTIKAIIDDDNDMLTIYNGNGELIEISMKLSKKELVSEILDFFNVRYSIFKK